MRHNLAGRTAFYFVTRKGQGLGSPLLGSFREKGSMGEFDEKAWDILRTLSPSDVSRRALASYDTSSGTYVLPVFNQGILVSPNDREIHGTTPVAGFLLHE